jgi:hypothetical protein
MTTRNKQISIALSNVKTFFGSVLEQFVICLEPDMFRMAPTRKM